MCHGIVGDQALWGSGETFLVNKSGQHELKRLPLWIFPSFSLVDRLIQALLTSFPSIPGYFLGL